MEEAKKRFGGWQWRDNLRALQVRVKQRLRIASYPRSLLVRLQYGKKAPLVVVAARRPKPFKALLSTFLANRFLASRRDNQALSSFATTSYYVSPPPQPDTSYSTDFNENSLAIRLLRAVALPVIGNVCHAFMHGLNHTEVYSADKLVSAVLNRPQGQPLITVSNHVASMDDPLVLAAILPPHVLFQANQLRWTLCATDRCFTSHAKSAFFECVKVLPLARGAGIYQKGVDMAVEKLRRGDWIHIFPEGSRSRDGGKSVQAAKRGVGRLVLDAGKVPLVIPFVHSGMQEVMPIGSKFPSIRKRVVVLVGDPIKMDDLFQKLQEGHLPKAVILEAIAFRVGQCLKSMKEELDHLVLSSREASGQKHLVYQRNRTNDDTDPERNVESSYAIGDRDAINRLDLSDDHRLRAAFGLSDGVLLLDSLPLARMNTDTFQEGIVTRLKRFRDPALFVGFAARGWLLRDAKQYKPGIL